MKSNKVKIHLVLALLLSLVSISVVAQDKPIIQTSNTSDGHLIMAGTFSGELELAGEVVPGTAGETGIFVAKFDTDGDLLWTTILDEYDFDTDIQLSIDSQNRVVLTLTYTVDTAGLSSENVSVVGLGSDGLVTFVKKGSIPIGG